MRKKTLILGAAGFIGTNLSLKLLNENKSLILFDREDASYQPDIRQEGADVVCWGGSFESYDWKAKEDELREVSEAYHLISTTCPTNTNQNVALEMEQNLIATIRFLDICVRAEVPKVIFLSSGGTVYGKEHTGICREEEEAFPITVYGVQKLGIEKMLYLYHDMYGLDYRIIRLANPYGPYQRPNGVQGAVSTFTWRAMHGMPIEVYGDGSVVRDYIYIEDAIEGILRIAESDGKHRLYNLGSGRGTSLLEVIKTIGMVLGYDPQVCFRPGRPVDVPVNVLDISRFRTDIGEFNPMELGEGVSRLTAFYRQRETV